MTNYEGMRHPCPHISPAKLSVRTGNHIAVDQIIVGATGNGYGLYDMAGNVWQWTTDRYQEHGKIGGPCCTAANPRGREREASYDPRQPDVKIPRKVTKGGSHLSAPNYYRRYRPAARMAQPIDTSILHCVSAALFDLRKAARPNIARFS